MIAAKQLAATTTPSSSSPSLVGMVRMALAQPYDMTSLSHINTPSRYGAGHTQLTKERAHEWLLIGGMHGYGEVSAMVSSYNMMTNTWHCDSSLVIARSQPAVAVDHHTGIVYAFGGYKRAEGNVHVYSEESLPISECYDPATRTWTLLSSHMNTRRYGAAAVYIPRWKVFLVGGGSRRTHEPTCNIELYNPATDIFIYVSSSTLPRIASGSHSLHLMMDHILVMIESHASASQPFAYATDIATHRTIHDLLTLTTSSSSSCSSSYGGSSSSCSSSAVAAPSSSSVLRLQWYELPYLQEDMHTGASLVVPF
jgi:hypothetical protein